MFWNSRPNINVFEVFGGLCDLSLNPGKGKTTPFPVSIIGVNEIFNAFYIKYNKSKLYSA